MLCLFAAELPNVLGTNLGAVSVLRQHSNKDPEHSPATKRRDDLLEIGSTDVSSEFRERAVPWVLECFSASPFE
jgi:hypothetical protein